MTDLGKKETVADIRRIMPRGVKTTILDHPYGSFGTWPPIIIDWLTRHGCITTARRGGLKWTSLGIKVKNDIHKQMAGMN